MPPDSALLSVRHPGNKDTYVWVWNPGNLGSGSSGLGLRSG